MLPALRQDRKESVLNAPVMLILLVLPSIIYTESITQSTVGALSVAFPALSADTIKQIQTITPLITMTFALLSGVLSRWFSRKKILLASLVLILAGGLSPLLLGNTFAFLLWMKSIFSVGYGLSLPIINSVLIDLVPEGALRDRMVGWRNAVGGACSIIFSALAGWLAGMNYHYPYALFLLIVPLPLLIWRRLPDVDLAPEPEEHAGKAKLTVFTLLLGLFNIIINLSTNAFFSSVSLVIVQSGAGTSAQSGLAISAYSAVTFLVGMIYSRIRGAFRTFTLFFSVLMQGVCFAVLCMARSYAAYILGSLIFGFSFGVYNPTLTLIVAKTIRLPKDGGGARSVSNTAFAVIVFCQAVGQCFSTKVLRFFSDLVGFQSLKGPWEVCAIYLFFAALVSFFVSLYIHQNKRSSEEPFLRSPEKGQRHGKYTEL